MSEEMIQTQTVRFEKNKVSPPVYSQIALDIAAKIARGELKESAKIHGRSLLSAAYSVSPETIRRSMRVLADVGIVDIKSNSGAVVLSREKAMSYVQAYGTGRSARSLKQELKELLRERETIDKKVIELVDEIVSINERQKSADPLQNFEIEIPAHSSLVGKSIEASKFWQNTGATIVAIRRTDKLILSPGPYACFEAGDSVIFVGDFTMSDRVKVFIEA